MLSQRFCSATRLSRISRTLSTLAFVERSGLDVTPGSLSALTAARQIGGPVTAIVAGSNGSDVANKVAKFPGIEKVLYASSSVYDHQLPENLSTLLAEVAKQGGFTHVVAQTSSVGRSIVPRAAALLNCQSISDVIKIDSQDTFVRPIFAGNALATVKALDAVKLLTVRPTAFEAIDGDGGTASTEAVTGPEAPEVSEWVAEQLTKSERPDLGTASRVVSGGRGLKNKENFEKIMYPFADALGAAVGASRAAVDSGFADNSLQVGQTGKVVAPEFYVAVGISGAIQHLAGMKDSKVIAAVNKDEDAPIFHVADVGLVGDLFETVPEITQKLK